MLAGDLREQTPQSDEDGTLIDLVLDLRVLVVWNSSAIVDGDAVEGLECCFRMTPSECSKSSTPSHGPVMKGGLRRRLLMDIPFTFTFSTPKDVILIEFCGFRHRGYEGFLQIFVS
ncbi:hypothetical protein L1987_15745 [Smallanthus sonchifolius]|uniref:Uncharacterized protein n=1 Tax=Smallanthus sonchifolius TaxID=185202 RepID=A0ACB9J6X9_9ASTR|nr:hypothetical protein L1987_15745 [Smallanthus sonchifolius]